MSGFEGSDDEVRDLVGRFRFVYVGLALTLVVIFSRLWYLQITQGEELHEFSEKNRVKENKIHAPRGLILDREGRILVDNVVGFDATIIPQYASKLDETAKEVGAIIGMEPEKIAEAVRASRRKNGPFMPVVLKENLSYEEVFRLKRIRIDQPGLNVDETVIRLYPLGENGAQLFGYVGEVSKKQIDAYAQKYNTKVQIQQGDSVGQNGLEEMWDPDLRGRDGLSFVEVDAHGRQSPSENKEFMELKPQAAVPGHNLVLTIDRDIQTAALKAMTEQKDKIGPRIGGLVVLKTNGEILAWVNTPSFDPNQFARGLLSSDAWDALAKDPFKPFINKIIQDHYAPGSTIKPIVAIAALQEGVITPNTIISAPGQMRFGNRVYHDSLRGGHGDITVFQAIEESSNIFFYKMGIQLGIDNIAKYAKAMGLGSKTNVGLSSEVSGVFPTKEWKLKTKDEAWQPGENLSNAIGQGFVLVNLLQMTMAFNTIANDGKLFQPLLVKQIQDENHKPIKEFESKLVRDITTLQPDGTIVDKKNIATVREAMRRVANGAKGTARWWKIPGVEMAGKTGTSQVMSFSADSIYEHCENRPLAQRHHGTFIAFAPAANPEVIVGVLAEHSCHGNMGGGPVVRDVILAYMQKYHPDLLKSKEKEKSIEVTPVQTEDEHIDE